MIKSKKKTNGGLPRAGSKLAKIRRLLERSRGCTRAEVMAAAGWKSIGLATVAKQAGIKRLKVDRDVWPYRYRAV